MNQTIIDPRIHDPKIIERLQRFIDKSAFRLMSEQNTGQITTLYDQYHAKILEKKEFGETDCQYDIYDNTYDEYGNVTMVRHSVVYNNELVVDEVKNYFEYRYNELHQVIFAQKLDENHQILQKTEHEYCGSRLTVTRKYQNEYGMGDESIPCEIHTFYYKNEGQLERREIHDGKGNWLCSCVFSEKKQAWLIKNPFGTKYSWRIEKIGEDSITVHVCELFFDCAIMKDIVDHLLEKYPKNQQIYISASWGKLSNEESERVGDFMIEYANQKKVQVAFV